MDDASRQRCREDFAKALNNQWIENKNSLK